MRVAGARARAGCPARRRPRSPRGSCCRSSTGTTWPSGWAAPKVVDDVPERTELPGVATGLAVTGHGGDVLFIETTAFPTSADAEPGLTLTGQLGDVMKESAQIALNYVRSHAVELGVDPDAVASPVPRPRAGRCRAQGRPVGGHHDDDGAGQPARATSRSRTPSG